MIISEKHINARTLENVIGKPIKIDWKKPRAIGSASFFLQYFKSKEISKDYIKEGSKCNFEKYSDGLLLRSNFSNKISALALSKAEIVRIKLIRGEEIINPFMFSPMWILLKLGISKLTARYFRIYLGEYSIDEMKLQVETKNHSLKFIQNGYIFERQLTFFESLGYQDKLIVEMND